MDWEEEQEAEEEMRREDEMRRANSRGGRRAMPARRVRGGAGAKRKAMEEKRQQEAERATAEDPAQQLKEDETAGRRGAETRAAAQSSTRIFGVGGSTLISHPTLTICTQQVPVSDAGVAVVRAAIEWLDIHSLEREGLWREAVIHS